MSYLLPLLFIVCIVAFRLAVGPASNAVRK